MTDSVLNLIIKAQENASKVFNRVNNSANRLSISVLNLGKKGFASLNNTMRKTANIMKIGLVAGIAGVGIAMGKMTQAYAVQERAETELQTLVMNVTGARQEHVEQLKAEASALQKVGVIGDEVTISGQAQLATFALSKDAISKLTPGIADMVAKLKGHNATAEDATNISNLFGKVMSGQVGALSRYGVTLSENQTELLKNGNEMERAAILAEVIEQNYGGVNESLAKTPTGQITQLKNNFGDLQELLGGKIQAVLGKLATKANEWLDNVDGGVAGISNAITEVFELVASGGESAMDGGYWIDQVFGVGVADKIANVSKHISNFVDKIKNVRVDAEILKAAFAGFITLISGGLIYLIGSLVAAVAPFLAVIAIAGTLFYLFENNQPLLAAIGAVIAAVLIPVIWAKVTALYAAATAWIAATWPILAILAVLGAVVYAIVWTYQNWEQASEIIASVASFIGQTIADFAKGVWTVLTTVFSAAVNAVIQYFTDMWNGAVYIWNQFWTFVINIGSKIKDAIIQAMIGMVVGLIAWHVKMVNKGIENWQKLFSTVFNAVQNFRNRVIGVFQSIGDGIRSAFRYAMNNVTSNINAAIRGVNTVISIARKIPGAGSIPFVPEIPAFAKGVRNFGGGLAIVGEQGPELVNLPAGSDVYSNRESQSIARDFSNNQASGGDTYITIHVDPTTPYDVVRYIENELNKKFSRI